MVNIFFTFCAFFPSFISNTSTGIDLKFVRSLQPGIGKRQNADPRSVDYLRGPGPWTTFVNHGPLQWTTLVDHLRDIRFWGFEFLTVHGKMCSSRVQSVLSLWKLYTKCEVLNPFTI
jgi:hypothetical protein